MKRTTLLRGLLTIFIISIFMLLFKYSPYSSHIQLNDGSDYKNYKPCIECHTKTSSLNILDQAHNEITEVTNGNAHYLSFRGERHIVIKHIFSESNISRELNLPKLYVEATGQLGHCIYKVLSGLALAHQSNHQLVLGNGLWHWKNIFPNLNITYEVIPESIHRVHELGYAHFTPDVSRKIASVDDVLLVGYYQSYKYFQYMTEEQTDVLRFSHDIYTEAYKLLLDAAAFGHNLHGENVMLTYVAMHVQRGDMTNKHQVSRAYIIADQSYLDKAMQYFRGRYSYVVFLLTSDDKLWCTSNIKDDDVWLQNSTQPDYIDLALLSLCNHTIMTVGTYGWIAAWMAGGEVTYYEPAVNFSREVGKGICAADNYPAAWIPLSVYNHKQVKELVKHRGQYTIHRPCGMITNMNPISGMMKKTNNSEEPLIT